MTRSELISKLSYTYRGLTQAEIEAIVDRIFGDITDTLKKGGRVELRGFGTFSLRHRKPRTGRNPRTGETVHVEGKSVPFFKSGKELKQLLNAN
ncbi:integration host factor subunit beta [Candidatus Odyssella thessalonicensis]|uniref:integration host factor subunit beta n=1 Tax=Candidatus Odyssella thessalonicensis TaxID=84647 RepID=UPI000225B90E|nr:integration host factor subunit beta [Candidatus Odyssella thessalonicensis]